MGNISCRFWQAGVFRRKNLCNIISFLNDLKIRGGYGVLGNEQTTPGWKYLSVADINPPSYNLGNPNVNNLGVAFKVAANRSNFMGEKKINKYRV